MSDDWEREFRIFQETIRTHVRMMGEGIRRHQEALEKTLREHRSAMKRARDDFERSSGSQFPGPRRPRGKRRKPGPELDLGGVPVKPNNPKGMSGGAAASIDASD